MSPLNHLQLDQKETRTVLAMQAFKQGHFSSVRAAAQTYDIPESTLRARVNGVVA